MPVYEYVCEQCDNHIELMQKITEEPLKTCPYCKGQLKKMISSTSFVLKGTGWYATDYASGKNSSPKTPETKTQKDNSTKSTEEKSEAKEPAAASSK